MLLDKFWKGEISPGEGRYHISQEYARSYKTMERCETFLTSHLDEKYLQVFQEFADASQEASALGCCDNFIDGFRMGARMMMDVLMD